MPVPSKSKPYVSLARRSTFISSVSLHLDGLSFQSPTKGLSAAAPIAQVPKPVEIAAKAIAEEVRNVNFTRHPFRGYARPQFTAGMSARWINSASRANRLARARSRARGVRKAAFGECPELRIYQSVF